MSIYQISKIEVSDREKLEEYVGKATSLIESHGGKFLAKQAKVEDLDGDTEDGVVSAVIEWPNRDSLKAFIDSDERKKLADLREEAGDFEVLIIEGL